MEEKFIVFGTGCFWCSEAIFKLINGVTDVVPGYAGGHTENPTYRQVCTDKTGHAEVVKVSYNPEVISRNEILYNFFFLRCIIEYNGTVLCAYVVPLPVQ